MQVRVELPDLPFLKVGQLSARYYASGTRILSFFIELTHTTANRHKIVSAPEIDLLQHKLDLLVKQWTDLHEAQQRKATLTTGKARAEEITLDASALRDRLRNLLRDTLRVDDAVRWDDLKPKVPFQRSRFTASAPNKHIDEWLPAPPKIGFLDTLFGRKKQKLESHDARVRKVNLDNQKGQEAFATALAAYESQRKEWEQAQDRLAAAHAINQAEAAARVDALRHGWEVGDAAAITEHAGMVLDASDYPGLIPKDFDVSFEPGRHLLVVDYQLPAPSALPITKSTKFIASSGEFTETEIPKAEQAALYDTVCYQVALRTLHELFEADTPRNINAICFNGLVRSINPATGQETEATLLSVMADRSRFEALNLDAVEPKACFKSLHGVSASSLAGLAPVPPLIRLDKKDDRFVESMEIDLGETGGVNLASMPWEDFEHLVRQIFEKEFSQRGGDVKITRASADGGVDAVAFDSDPISGGKIVIQAKRYTRTVDVSAVRDLYGTTQAEGAIKGILVTTADYGPDAYRFAEGKPITLLSGANLLHLMEKHGMRARIDLVEARKEMKLVDRP